MTSLNDSALQNDKCKTYRIKLKVFNNVSDEQSDTDKQPQEIHDYSEEENSKFVPVMGTNALLHYKPVSDSEIIAGIVRDKFVTNFYRLNTLNRSVNRFIYNRSRFERMYKSLEQAFKVGAYNGGIKSGVFLRQDKSFIEIKDKLVSINTTLPAIFSPEKNEFLHKTFPTKYISEKNNFTLNKYELLPQELPSSAQEKDLNNHEISNSKCEETQNSLYVTCGEFETNQDATMNDTIESYNMEEFLKNALGDELYSDLDSTRRNESEIINFPEADESVRTMDVSALISKDGSDVTTNKVSDSVCTDDASGLMSKVSTFQSNIYKSIRRKLKHFCGSVTVESQKIEEILDLDVPDCGKKDLVLKALIQYQTIEQLSKALALCKQSKEFAGGLEELEGERLLLVASYTRKILLEEINRPTLEQDDTIPKGQLTLRNISIPLKEIEIFPQGCERWYVCVISCKSQVVSSKLMFPSPDNCVRFFFENTKPIMFTNVEFDFVIKLSVYCLVQRRRKHESKYHSDKRIKYCPTPKNLLQKKMTKQDPPFENNIQISSFKQCGSLQLKVKDISEYKFKLTDISPTSNLLGTIELHMDNLVKFTGKQSGFLALGSETKGCLFWNQLWFILDGTSLKYWIYPPSNDTCKPFGEIDLKTCVTNKVDLADRMVCARQRTLLLETVKKSKMDKMTFAVDRYFLSADTNDDLEKWRFKLNNVLKALHKWHIN